MPIKEGQVVDGNSDWSGGCNASLDPSDIAQNQYFRACNIIIPRTGGGLTNRGGFHYQRISWANTFTKNTYENGHIQGEGWYNDGSQNILLRSVDGYIIEFRKITNDYWHAKVINGSNPLNPNTPKVWFTRIPGGSIVNDGESIPLIVSNQGVEESNADEGGITPGRMGVYLQNRFFYVTPDGKFIQASDYNSPTSIANSSATNIHGWLVPQDEDVITAIGKQKVILDYLESGSLVFSTENDIYSVDVRGAREDWEEVSTNRGKIGSQLPSIGAVSSYSFEPYNTNLYFRTFDFGLCDLRQSQYQFVQENDFQSQSIEVDYWFGNDSEFVLDQCYTRRYKNRLFTTVGAQLDENGYVFWNGLISMHPRADQPQRGENFPRRFEGLFTGVRPWCITVTQRVGKETEFFIDSKDNDGVNRLYKYVDKSGFDINHKGERIEIESWLETRSYDFQARNELKDIERRHYKIGGLKRDTRVDIYTRPEATGPWLNQNGLVHRVKSCCTEDKNCFNPVPVKPQSRPITPFHEEPDNTCSNPGAIAGSSFYTRQFRLEIKGEFRLRDIVFVANYSSSQARAIAQCEEDQNTEPFVFQSRLDYTYNIAKGNNLTLRETEKLEGVC